MHYSQSAESLTAQSLRGFFVGWPNPPQPETLLQVLQRAATVVIAKESALENTPVIGFAYAISDGHLCAYIPLLEVLPAFQGQGVASEIMRRLNDTLSEHYMVDLSCDADLISFYERLGFTKATAMISRNYDAI